MKPSIKTVAKIRRLLENYSLFLSLGALAAITFASLSPRGSTGDPGAMGVPDSAAHFVAYAVVIIFRAATPSASLLWPTLVVLAWSISIELLQSLIDRSNNFQDVFANAMGILVGSVIGYYVRALLLKLSEPDT